MEKEMLEIIIKQNFINTYLLQAIFVKEGMTERNLKFLQKSAEKEANRLFKELFNEN